MGESGEVTQILAQAKDGNQQALQQLIAVVYQELRRLAEYYMQHERPEHTLQVTELVPEAYLRLVGRDAAQWQDRLHFFAAAAQVVRRLLVGAWARTRTPEAGDPISPTGDAPECLPHLRHCGAGRQN